MHILSEIEAAGASTAIGVLSALGLKQRLLSALALSPPEKKTYSICQKSGKFSFEKTERNAFLHKEVKKKGFFLKSSGSKIACVLLSKESVEERPLLVFAHGNSSDLGQSIKRLERLCLETEVDVVVFDYTGYGQSSGMASIQNCLGNIQTIFKWCENQILADSRPLLLYGHSIGAYMLLNGFSSYPRIVPLVNAVILESPFASGLKCYFPSVSLPLPFDCLRNEKKIGTLEVPVLLIHAQDDTIIDISNSELLASKCKSELLTTWWPETGGHCSIDKKNRHEYESRIRSFIATEVVA